MKVVNTEFERGRRISEENLSNPHRNTHTHNTSLMRCSVKKRRWIKNTTFGQRRDSQQQTECRTLILSETAAKMYYLVLIKVITISTHTHATEQHITHWITVKMPSSLSSGSIADDRSLMPHLSLFFQGLLRLLSLMCCPPKVQSFPQLDLDFP